MGVDSVCMTVMTCLVEVLVLRWTAMLFMTTLGLTVLEGCGFLFGGVMTTVVNLIDFLGVGSISPFVWVSDCYDDRRPVRSSRCVVILPIAIFGCSALVMTCVPILLG